MSDPIRDAIHAWIREDVPLAGKMNLMPKHVDALIEKLAARAPQKDGVAAMQWKPTGSGTASINGMGGTTEWFRQFDGRRESYPHGFNPNIGAYVDACIGLSNPPPPDLTTEAQKGKP